MLRRFDGEQLRQRMQEAGLTVELVQGQDVFTDLVPGAVADGGAAETLADLERGSAGRAPLRDIAARLHAIGRVPS